MAKHERTEYFAGDPGHTQLDAFRDKQWIPVYMSKRGEIIDYFKDTYTGRDKRGNEVWKSHAAMEIAGTSDKKSREYKSAMRQFQFDKRTGKERYQGEKVTKATEARYEAVGQKLPPATYKIPDSVTVTITGLQGQRERTIPTVTLKGTDLFHWMQSPTYEQVFEKAGYLKAYPAMSGDLGDSGALAVTSVQ